MPERLIDVPLESLPFVDEHTTDVRARAEDTWAAMLDYFGGKGADRLTGPIAAALGCIPAQRCGIPGEIGSTIPGFIVTRSIAPAVLALMGQHRFARYALIFRIAELPEVGAGLSAETRAEFPGRAGSVYRTLVIGTRGHVVATRRMLRSIRLRAEAQRD